MTSEPQNTADTQPLRTEAQSPLNQANEVVGPQRQDVTTYPLI